MIDGNDIWEALFGILEGDVPDALDERVCEELAAALSPTLLSKEETIEAIQCLLERGKATLDNKGYLVLVEPVAGTAGVA